MRSITLHTIFPQVEKVKKTSMNNFFRRLMGYKFIDVPDTAEYKYNPEQYCVDRGIIQHPSSFQTKGHHRLRIKDK